MAEHGLSRQSDMDDLSAWMDGELAPQAARRVERLVRDDPNWRRTHQQFQAVEAGMKLLPQPRPRRDLTETILRAARRRRRMIRAAEVLAPLAAAGLLLAVVLNWAGGPTTPAMPSGLEARMAAVLGDLPKEDWFIVQNLSLFRNYDEVVDYQEVQEIVDGDTLTALAALEAEGNL